MDIYSPIVSDDSHSTTREKGLEAVWKGLRSQMKEDRADAQAGERLGKDACQVIE